jgi:hypothetical protein
MNRRRIIKVLSFALKKGTARDEKKNPKIKGQDTILGRILVI